MTNKAQYGILFVCTGNICRSPTAEGVFRHLVRQEGDEGRFRIDSAGTQGYHAGTFPDERAVAVARQHGVCLDNLHARRLQEEDFQNFDMILAMDNSHLDFMNTLAPQDSRASLSLFLDFTPQIGCSDVPDPYYGSLTDFEEVFDLVEQGSNGLLRHLKKEQIA